MNKTKGDTAKPKPNAKAGRLDAKTCRVSYLTLSSIVGLPVPTLQGIMAKAGVTNDGGLLLRDAGTAIVAHYKGLSESESNERSRDKDRQTKAAANREELALMRELKEVRPVAECRRLMETCFVEAREAVRKLKCLSLDQQKEVCELIATMKLKEDQE